MNELVVDILNNFLGEPRKHNESTGQISWDCPACDDGKGKGNLEVNYNKGVFHCWSCKDINHMSGRIFTLIKRFGGSRDIDNYNKLAPKLTYDTEYKSNVVEVVTGLPDEFIPLNRRSSDTEYNLAMAYLKARNITSEHIYKFRLGYCNEGKYANRIIIPSYDKNGLLNYYSGRTYKDWIRPKYLNTDADKLNIIFNEKLISWDSTIYLVEGPFDHLVVPNSIPLLGKALDIDYELFYTILEKSSAYVVLVLDSDAWKDSETLYNRLNTLNLKNRIRVVKIPDGYDIAKIHEILGKDGVIKVLKQAGRFEEFKKE